MGKRTPDTLAITLFAFRLMWNQWYVNLTMSLSSETQMLVALTYFSLLWQSVIDCEAILTLWYQTETAWELGWSENNLASSQSKKPIMYHKVIAPFGYVPLYVFASMPTYYFIHYTWVHYLLPHFYLGTAPTWNFNSFSMLVTFSVDRR